MVLGIIGVIAVLTISPLLQNAQKQQYVVALKKNYSIVQTVINQYMKDQDAKTLAQADIMKADVGLWYESSALRQAEMETPVVFLFLFAVVYSIFKNLIFCY